MGDFQEADPEKEKKRQKALRRMGKILGRAWELPEAEHFHGSLGAIGEKLDKEAYRYGRHGWEDFSKDIGGVYNRHIHRKTKHVKAAKSQLDQVASWLGEKDESLATAAREHIPEDKKGSKKRKPEENGDSLKARKRPSERSTSTSKPPPEGDITLGEREERAMENLFAFIEENGGDRRAVENYRCRVTRKPSDGRYDTNYYNEQGKRFRSMVEVGKFLSIVAAPARSAGGKKAAGMKKRKTTSREIENEKKKLRKELDKLRKQHTRARKQLDDFLTDEKDTKYPMEDMLLQEEKQSQVKKVLPTNCPAARIPDIDAFPGLPQHFMPEVLATWDFLCTFTRHLNVDPISLDDFVQCLVYKQPPNLADSDVFNSPPVFLGEAHLGLLKLILADRSSDDWWWSILETDITENAVADTSDAVGTEESDLPLIKVDFAAMLLETEDPLITTSWLQNLEQVRNLNPNDMDGSREAIRSAMAVVANRWVLAYLRKALKLGKTSGSTFMNRSVIWLVEKVKEARPDLTSRSVNTKSLLQKRANVVEEVTQQMEKLSSSALTVTDDDLSSDIEDSDDESDDDSDDEEEKHETVDHALAHSQDPDERPASYIPKKPLPSLVDLLLPPGKPFPTDDILNPASWPQIAGAAVTRIIHRYKRLRNELDDSLRLIRELPRLTVKQRREREVMASKRVFSEFATADNYEDPPQKAADHLCSGGNYLELSPVQRLCILRVLIDAAYDTGRAYEIVDSNYKQRTNAVKALDTEQRRAKKEAKEKAAAAEAAAREDLALEARRKFLEEKREEIRNANKVNQELTEEEIDDLTEEDILDFDDDIRADFEALPSADGFKKAEVVARVEQIKEAAAFETDLLTVLAMPELLDREKAELKSLQEQFEELGGDDALSDPGLDRSIARRIEKTRRDIHKAQAYSESLPIQREAAMDSLREAIADGTIKSLRAAIRIAKSAKLFGHDEYSNGVWALDLVRDAHIELENAKNLKRVADAQNDLITKLNKCFIRTDPLGLDRFRNRLWRFENTEQCHIWAEVNPVFDLKLTSQEGYLQIISNVAEVSVGSADIEEDFQPRDKIEAHTFGTFSRQEYHASGSSACLVKRHWGCHATEMSVRALMKGLDGRGVREDELKKNLKEALEKATAAESSAEETKAITVDNEESKAGDREEEVKDEKEKSEKAFKTTGDEGAFNDAKRLAQESQIDFVQYDLVSPLSSGIGKNVRVRIPIETGKDYEMARYEDAEVLGWSLRKDEVPVELDGDEFEPTMTTVHVPIWLVVDSKGRELWLTGTELLQGLCRFEKRKNGDPTYFESDAVFLSYRNSLGRHCGKASEAGQAMTPIRFANFMVRREGDLYQRLKHVVFENTWGGKNGNRNAWVASMKDFAFDFETAREGLLTLESALVEMTGGMPESSGDEPSGKEILENPLTRDDIELESLDKGVKGLWNSATSRAVFLEIIGTCKAVGFLALGLELLCRNTQTFLDANTVKGAAAAVVETGVYGESSIRSTRRTSNAWQQQDDSIYYDDMPVRSTRRVARVNYVGLD